MNCAAFIKNQLRFETPPFRAVGAEPSLKAGVLGGTVLARDANPFQNTFDRLACRAVANFLLEVPLP